MECQILSIDAWRGPEGGWEWNAWYPAGTYDLEENETTRKTLKKMRDLGLLSEYSKGRVAVEDDEYNIVIKNKNTHEPLFAIEYGPHLC